MLTIRVVLISTKCACAVCVVFGVRAAMEGRVSAVGSRGLQQRLGGQDVHKEHLEAGHHAL